MASRVTMLPCRANWSRSAGMAVISLDLSSTQRWPSTSPCALAQALTRCSGARSCLRSNERRSVFVDGDHLALEAGRQRGGPGREAGLERLGVDQHEHASEGVVRGDAVRQLEEGPQPGQLAATVERNVVPVLGAGWTCFGKVESSQ